LKYYHELAAYPFVVDEEMRVPFPLLLSLSV